MLFFTGGGDAIVDGVDPGESGTDHFGAWISLYSGNEVEVVAHGGLVGAKLGPFVADETDPLRWVEPIFHVRNKVCVKRRRIGAAVIALAGGVGKEQVGGRHRQGGLVGREELAILSAVGSLEADRHGPLLGCVGLSAGAQEEALLTDATWSPEGLAKVRMGSPGCSTRLCMILSTGL